MLSEDAIDQTPAWIRWIAQDMKGAPSDWDLQRRQGYFDWAMAVIDRLRGVHGPMEAIFDDAYAKRP